MILAIYLSAWCLVMIGKTGSMWFAIPGCVMLLIAEFRYGILKDRVKKLEEKEKNYDSCD